MSTTRRLVQLVLGLALFGASIAVLVRAGLGLFPWDVLHQGVARATGLPLGVVVVLASVAVLVLWIPLRQRPGLGTVANVVLVGVFVDLSLAVLPAVEPLPWRIVLLVAGVVLNAAATGLYIGAGYGPGPRDGLMTGLAARGWPLDWSRLAIELAVLGIGIALGGTVGAGTVVYALAVGPLVRPFLTLFTVRTPRPADRLGPAPTPSGESS
ncbi:YczE/YyaS/YitT family protein [Cellulosimicrobium cellulans]|uniref:membrane protein YczE n=1 Tax=Cellulosimicrobium cellulans TaxID=1710 RepID=UPI00030E9B86|nr:MULTISPECIES: membrane protein [Cellulosimicrobium]KFD42649.1 membrane protein [Cellulosimicrobium sp. MM]